MSLERPRRPEEGWLTIALVLLMQLVVASAIDDPGWVNGNTALTDNLAWFAAMGVLIGFAGPKLGLGRWTTHAVGAIAAGLIIPVVAGFAEYPGSSIPEAFGRTAAGSVQAYLDIAWRGLDFTAQEVHYIVVLGIVVWGTAQFASYAVFGHRHPLNAVVVSGLVLVVNMSATFVNQLPYLVLFTGCSLFLLIEMHAFDERATWIRRRIGDPGTISSLYLRGGTVFIFAALLGSLILTQRASSSPLGGAWVGVSARLIELSDTVGRLLPVGGAFRGVGGVVFGESARFPREWQPGSGIAFEATLPANAPEHLYWRAITYNRFALGGWDQTAYRDQDLNPGDALPLEIGERPPAGVALPMQVQVRPDGYHQPLVLAPGPLAAVDRAATVRLVGDGGSFGHLRLPGESDYGVTSTVLLFDKDTTPKGKDTITGNELKAASRDYPQEIVDLYTEVPPDAMGPDADALLRTIKALANSNNPYVLASTMVDYLGASKPFSYDPDLRDNSCSSRSEVECFARTQRGFCLQYASTMAILLRAADPDHPIPTRFVQGYLPGKRTGNVETVESQGAHAWVEVYFPGYGWIPFDPTGHGVGAASPIELGPPVANATPAPVASDDDRGPDPLATNRADGAAAGTSGPTRGGNQPGDRMLFIVLTIALAAIVLGVALAAWLRGPRGEITPESAWTTMSRAASRLGFGPRPTQTVYEYAASLGDLVPVARADLAMVAEAKVETTYARVRLGGERLEAIRHATRRLRISLLRLALRRGRRRRPSRPR